LGTANEDARDRLAAYWQARDGYLKMGARTLTAKASRDFIASIAPGLIDLVRTSPDFEPAYLPVLAMARQLAVSDPKSARRLLETLDKANPARFEARRLLMALPPG
jgi:spermidine synthase